MLTSKQLWTALQGVAAEGLYRFEEISQMSAKYNHWTVRFEEFQHICKEEHDGSEWLELSDSDGEV